MDKVKIGIIGGTGGMGKWFEDFFTSCDAHVTISGRKTGPSFEELAKASDILILSVPMGAAIDLAKSLGPLMSKNQLLTDFCSMKEDICIAMAESGAPLSLGLHPLFGPQTASIKGMNIIFCEDAQSKDTSPWANALEKMFVDHGAIITRMDPVEHDKKMALVQGLNHFMTICLAGAMKKLDIKPEDAAIFSTPIFRLKLDIVGRLFAQDTSLYADLIKKNRHVPEVLDTFKQAMFDASSAFTGSDDDAAGVYLDELNDFFDKFSEQGLTESSKVLDFLYT